VTLRRSHGLANLVGRGHLLTPNHDLGAVLEVTFGGHVGQGRRAHELPSRYRLGGEDGVALDEANHPFDHPDEALAAGIHHPGFLEHSHEFGGPGQGNLSFVQQPVHEIADVHVRVATRSAAAAASRATVRMVPSRGSSREA
jgi:hypothetical protein